MTCIHEFIISCLCSIFINPYVCKFVILIPKCSEKVFEDVKRWKFASGRKSKGVRSRITYTHKSRGKSTGAFNIEKRKIHMKYNLGENFETSVVETMGILVAYHYAIWLSR